jgi:hypothetical protein
MMQSIKPANQLWLATHNPEILDEAPRDRLIYVSRDRSTHRSQVTLGTDEPEALARLREFFGHSGYLGVARAMVFLEGIDSSLDRRLFSQLFPALGAQVKLVPSTSVTNLERMNVSVLKILEAGLGWMQFFAIRDRDFLSDQHVEAIRANAPDRLYVLDRYHIENYLLVDEAIATVQEEIFSQRISPNEVGEVLQSLACAGSAEVTSKMIAYRINATLLPTYVDAANFMKGQSLFKNSSQEIDDSRWRAITPFFTNAAASALDSYQSRLESSAVEAIVASCEATVRESLSGTEWRKVLPGRWLLERYASHFKLGKPSVLQNSILKELSANPGFVPAGLRSIIKEISVSAALG